VTALSSRIGRRRRRDDEVGAIDLLSSDLVGYSGDATGWDLRHQCLVNEIRPDVARAAHLGGRTYSVVRRDAGQVIVVSFVHGHEVKVTRHDQSGTVPIEVREFREFNDRLWLRGIKRTNGGDSVPADRRVTDWFTWVRPDTTATWTRFDHDSPQGRAQELVLEWDPAPHWYDRPAFADYAELIGPSDLLRQLWPGVHPLAFWTHQAARW
jgi:hypothetical protein